MIKDINGFVVEQNGKIFNIIFPTEVTLKEAYDALSEAINRLVEISKEVEEKQKKEKEKNVNATEAIIVEKKEDQKKQ